MMGNGSEQVLFLGNSITLHGFASYWWGEWGMAASCLERDYVHRVIALMQDEGFMVHENVFNFFAWETMWHDRGQALQLLQNYVHLDLTLVVVQLAENISELGSMEQDYCDLIDYIRRTAPQARIIMLGSFWPKIDVELAKRRACEIKGIPLIDLQDMWSCKSYQSGMGTVVTGVDGKKHIVEHSGVAVHPGDQGMEEIARRIVEVWKNGMQK